MKTNINLNGNALYRIIDDKGNVLHQNKDYSLTNVKDDGSVVRFAAYKSYFSDLKETGKRKITFEFTDGDNQTLLITYKVNVPAVYVNGKTSFGQKINVILTDEYQRVDGQLELNTYQLLLADVNGDGYVNEEDQQLILKYINKQIESFPVEA